MTAAAAATRRKLSAPACRRSAALLRATRDGHLASLIASMAGTKILWLIRDVIAEHRRLMTADVRVLREAVAEPGD
jgi:hypothetical protein